MGMSHANILNRISTKGKFCYGPNKWEPETDKAIQELFTLGRIRVATKEEEPMNTEYIYYATKGGEG